MSSRLETLMESAWPSLEKAATKGLGPVDGRPITKLIPSRQLDPSVWKAIATYEDGPVNWTDDEAWNLPRVDTSTMPLSDEQLRRVEYDDELATQVEAWARQTVNSQERVAMQGLAHRPASSQAGSLEDQLREYRNTNMASRGPFTVAVKPDTIQAEIHGIELVTIAPEHFPATVDAIVLSRATEGLRIEWGHNLELSWDRGSRAGVHLTLQARYRFAGTLGSEHLIRVGEGGSGEVYQREDGKFAFRVKASNGEIVATDGGQGYSRRSDAKTTLEKLLRGGYNGRTNDA